MVTPETLNDLLINIGLTLSHNQIAFEAGISARNFSNLRKGRIAEARLATVSKLAQALCKMAPGHHVDPARVRAAIEASRAAAQSD